MAYALVIGPKGGRRAEAVRAIADALLARGVRVGGFTQRTIRPAAGASRIEIARLGGGEARTLARSGAGAAEDPASCSFVFDAAVLEEARRWVAEDAAAADVVVLDGVGTLELGGGGHRAALDHALAAARVALVSVRDDQLAYVLAALEPLGAGDPVAAFTAGEGPAALAAFAAEVARAARGQAAAT